jgi:hypothetical protein
MSLEGRCQVPGQEFVDADDWMVRDLGQDGAEAELLVEAFQFADPMRL